MGLDARKPVFGGRGGGAANNKGADQPAHSRSLISAFVFFAFWKVAQLNLLQAKFQLSIWTL